jgi:putative membrane protein
MFDDPWLSPGVRAQVRDRIVAIEQTTGAEVVVTVGLTSGYYRHADLLLGALCSLGMLVFYLFYPEPLDDDLTITLIVIAFPVGAFFCAAASPLRRWLVSRRLLRENVRREARSRFVDQGISRTRGRTGLLVYVSRFERCAEVVPDCGIPVEAIGSSWHAAVAALDKAASSRGSVPAFLGALDRLGQLLADAVPRSADDVNELPDEVAT